MQKFVFPKFAQKLGKGFLLAILLSLIIVSIGLALTLVSADGIWSNATGSNGSPTCLRYLNTLDITDENMVRYGDDDGWGCTSDYTRQSGFGYDGVENLEVITNTVFLLGEFTHYNRPIVANSHLLTVDLAISLDFSDPDINTTLDYTIQLDETPNQRPCAYAGSTVCPDKVDLSDSIADQIIGPIDGKYYKLQIIGFARGTADTCQYEPGNDIKEFITEEEVENHACLFARMLVEEPAIRIEKTPDLQYITTGSDAVFNIVISNVGNVDLENVAVADALTADCVRSGEWEGDTLPIGEDITYTCMAHGVTESFTNVAVVTGNAVGDPARTVTDDDDAVVTIQDSQITIIKNVVDEDLLDWWHYRDFQFTTASTGSMLPASFNLDDDCSPVISGCPASVDGQDAVNQESITFSNLVSGIYTFTENQPDGTTWLLAPQGGLVDGIACRAVEISSGEEITPVVAITNVSPYLTGNVAVTLGANQHVTCTFTNKPGPGGTAITLADMKAHAKSNYILTGSAFALTGILLLGAFISRRKRLL